MDPKPKDTKAAILRAAAKLLRRKGYAATGLNDLIHEADAPRGSVYHHFPGGKEAIAEAALTQSGKTAKRAIETALGREADPAAALEAYAEELAQALEASGFRDGCPIATVMLETAADNAALRAAGAGAFASWRDSFRDALMKRGVSRIEANRLAVTALAALEGGLVLARAGQDGAPLRAAAAIWLRNNLAISAAKQG